MCESLWKISHGFACVRFDLFREKIDVVGVTERGLEDLVRFLRFSATRQKIYFPKTANGKRAFMPLLALLVAVNQTAARHQSFPNACVRFLHSFRRSRLETVVRKKQHCCIHDVAAAGLRVAGKLRVPGTLLDLLPNVLPLGCASCDVEPPKLTARVHLQQS